MCRKIVVICHKCNETIHDWLDPCLEQCFLQPTPERRAAFSSERRTVDACPNCELMGRMKGSGGGGAGRKR